MNTNTDIKLTSVSKWNQRKLVLSLTILLPFLLLPDVADAQYTFTRLYRWTSQFNGGPDAVFGDLAEGSDGMLYGTVDNYTSNAQSIFRIRKDGTGYQLLASYLLSTRYLESPLFEASNGKLYAFFWNLAAVNSYDNHRLCRMNKDGTQFEVLRRLPLDLGVHWTGDSVAGLTFETPDGWLYGGYGPASEPGVPPPRLGRGAFRCRLDGSQFTILHTFGSVTNDGLDGVPQFLGNDGRVYGTAFNGGTTTNRYGGGTIWRMEKDGSGYQILHDFNLTPGGLQQPSFLVEDASGSLVGFANEAGLFKLNKDGSGYRELLRFGGPATSGITRPQINWFGARVDSEGFLYGQSLAGGRFGQGTAFRVRLDGTGFTILYHFGTTSQQDEDTSQRSLLSSRDGSFYGTHYNILPGDDGALGLYRLSPPRLQLAATRVGNLLRLSATGTTNTQWRLESRDTVTGTNAWQPLTNFTLGPSPTVIQQPLTSTNRFYRAAWLP